METIDTSVAITEPTPDTWNRQLDPEVLSSFVLRKLAQPALAAVEIDA